MDAVRKRFSSLRSGFAFLDAPGGSHEKFQEIQAAYDTLGDESKRAAYDNPAPNWAGAGNPGGFSFNFGGGPQFNTDFFNQMFGQQFGQAHQPRRSHMRMAVWITFKESILGGSKHLALQSQSGTGKTAMYLLGVLSSMSVGVLYIILKYYTTDGFATIN